MKRTAGFTLIELLIVLTIVGILLVIGVPSMSETVKNTRLATRANDIAGAISFARAEAIRRRATVTVSAAGNWGGQLTVAAPGETLRVIGAADSSLAVAHSAVTSIGFNLDGTTNLANLETIDICDDRTGETGRRISILVSGIASITRRGC